MYVSFFLGFIIVEFSKKTKQTFYLWTFLKIPPNSHFAPSIVNLWKRKFFAAIKQKIQAAADFIEQNHKMQRRNFGWQTNHFEKYIHLELIRDRLLDRAQSIGRLKIAYTFQKSVCEAKIFRKIIGKLQHNK